MEIKYLVTGICPSWEKGLDELKKALEELKIKNKIKLIKIKNLDEAKKYDFIGSPTVRINEAELGREIWKFTEEGTEVKEVEPNLTCRIYLFNGKVYEYPTKEMIKDFIKTYAVWKETDRASDDEGVKLK